MVFASLILLFLSIVPAHAQIEIPGTISNLTIEATTSAVSTSSAGLAESPQQLDLTRPEDDRARRIFNRLYAARPIPEPGFINIMEYTVQYAIRTGVPANTIILILLLPFLATLFIAARQIIGIPTLEMLVPIALSAALVATGLLVGAVLLASILIASIISQIILKRIRIMQLPKMALSLFLISIFVLMTLIAASSLRLFDVSQISFLPIILLVLLSDKIVSLQLTRGIKPSIVITFFTLLLGGIGYAILTYQFIRFSILLYPELILLLIPINIIIGRYFGLRLTEYHRFSSFRKYVD